MLRRLAIIGGGFAGLATAWYASQLENIQITLFDPLAPGEGTSGLASGLLHIYTGRKARPAWRGREAFEEAKKLVESVAFKFSDALVYQQTGLLRPAISDEQHLDFYNVSKEHPHLEWWEPAQCKEHVQGLNPDLPGLWIPEALWVHPKPYLEALWAGVRQRTEASWVFQTVQDLASLDNFDAIILAAGYDCRLFPEAEELPLRAVKGQVLIMRWPHALPPLPFPVSSGGHLIMLPESEETESRYCLAGATYERGWTDRLPNPEQAVEMIRSKISPFFPQVTEMEVVSCHAGLRAHTPQHLPLVQQLSERVWALTALGSKGLLYHALCAQELIRKLSSK